MFSRFFLALLALAFSASVFAQMHIENAIVRAMPPGQKVTAAYMLIANSSNSNKALISARSPAASAVEIHQSLMEDGLMKMRQIERLEIPAHGEQVLSPDGYHLMLFNLDADITEGDEVMLYLSFDDGSEQEVMAPVTRIKPSHDGDMGHDMDDVMHKVTPTKKETHQE